MYGDAPGAAQPLWWKRETALPFNKTTWSSIKALLQRPWFQRIWVLQEALLSGTKASVQCGMTTIPWLAIQKSLRVLGMSETIPEEMAKLIRPHALVMSPRPRDAARAFLGWVRHRGCSDPRDKVYGILGLLPERIRNEITVDYDKQVSQVHIDLVLAAFKGSQQLSLLQECHIDDRLPGTPTWLSCLLSRDVLHTLECRENSSSLLSAASNSSSVAQVVGGTELDLCGVRCATVSTICPVLHYGTSQAADRLRAMMAWQADELATMEQMAAGSKLDEFLYAILAGQIKEDYANSDLWKFPTISQVRSDYQRAIDGDTAPFNAILAYTKTYGIQGAGTCFVTCEGTIGFGPPAMQPGKHYLPYLSRR
jgi:hypothetical protein